MLDNLLHTINRLWHYLKNCKGLSKIESGVMRLYHTLYFRKRHVRHRKFYFLLPTYNLSKMEKWWIYNEWRKCLELFINRETKKHWVFNLKHLPLYSALIKTQGILFSCWKHHLSNTKNYGTQSPSTSCLQSFWLW